MTTIMSEISSEVSRRKPASLLLNIFYFMMIASWMFDFQSDGVGEGLQIQIYFMGSFIIFSGLFLFSDIFLSVGSKYKIIYFMHFAASTTIFLVVSVASGLSEDQEAYAVFRHVATILIYLLTAYATARMVLDGSLKVLRRMLGILCFGFAISTFVIVSFFGDGIDIETVRYEIQGTSSVAALGVLILMAVLNVTVVEILAGFSSAVVTYLTVTRTFLVEIVAQSLILLPMLSRQNLLSAAFRILLVVGASVVLFSFVGKQGLVRWLERLFVSDKFSGEDPTFYTRIDEWDYMWDEILSSGKNFFFGSGLAAETQWSLPTYLGGDGTVWSSIGFGHNQHLSLLFTGGIIGGIPLLAVQFFQVFHGMRFLLSNNQKIANEGKDLYFLYAWGVTIIIGYIAINFLSANFGNRGFSLWYGVGTGLYLGGYSRFVALEAERSR